jgi:transposase
MSMRRSGTVQDDLMATWAEMPRSSGHTFYDRLQELLGEVDFDAFVEQTCKPYYAPRMGAPSLPPIRYFRMHMIGYFEGIDSERGIVWRCADSFSLRDFLRLPNRDKVPDQALQKRRERWENPRNNTEWLKSRATYHSVLPDCMAQSIFARSAGRAFLPIFTFAVQRL